ncbi:hypothetical protein [Bradyrhizobium valentinum]|uniref:Uncharacterized protein n=1 Tax=Bradyrhizobium valentinum TaxID=1518501 RepID=A0A0R3M3Z7_9BRAD|nr:hypothetical protein [Bradyrhizobium valentinum]KRR14996.1 hypothetical protein CP49_23580 [Bradyrhizobium valentinum]
MADDEVTKEVASLARVQSYDTSKLPRRDDLGRELSFEEAVKPADRAVQLFSLIPLDLLPQIPKGMRSQVRSAADALFSILEQMQKFSAQQASATEIRLSLINQLTDNYEAWFTQLSPAILFATSTRQDFSRLEREARAASQAAADEAASLTKKLVEHETEANRVLAEVRKVAAEQGVGFQAVYFKTEADSHDTIAKDWRTYTIVAAVALGIVAAASIFLYKIPFLHPGDVMEAVQFSLAKLAILAVMGYALMLCSRTFLAHTHNAIVNRHRQNALLTFQALVNAAKEESQKDIILTHASACMFSPQETGFTKHASEGTSNIIQLLGKAPGMEKAAS